MKILTSVLLISNFAYAETVFVQLLKSNKEKKEFVFAKSAAEKIENVPTALLETDFPTQVNCAVMFDHPDDPSASCAYHFESKEKESFLVMTSIECTKAADKTATLVVYYKRGGKNYDNRFLFTCKK